MHRTSRLLLTLATAAVATACGTGGPPPAGAPPTVALGAPQPAPGVQQPIPDSQLTPGVRYRFEDVVAPHVLDVELTAPDPPVWDYHSPTVTVLSTTQAADVDALWFFDPDELRVPVDPYFSAQSLASEDDFMKASRDVPRVLITQNLDVPGAQQALDTAAFVPGS